MAAPSIFGAAHEDLLASSALWRNMYIVAYHLLLFQLLSGGKKAAMRLDRTAYSGKWPLAQHQSSHAFQFQHV